MLCGELGLDLSRIRAWGMSHAVLAACWSLEDSGRVWSEALSFARLIAES